MTPMIQSEVSRCHVPKVPRLLLICVLPVFLIGGAFVGFMIGLSTWLDEWHTDIP